jgi:hypothetical protein
VMPLQVQLDFAHLVARVPKPANEPAATGYTLPLARIRTNKCCTPWATMEYDPARPKPRRRASVGDHGTHRTAPCIANGRRETST